MNEMSYDKLNLGCNNLFVNYILERYSQSFKLANEEKSIYLHTIGGHDNHETHTHESCDKSHCSQHLVKPGKTCIITYLW